MMTYRSRLGIGCLAVLALGVAGAEEKDDVTAGFLGGMVGLGAPYYYLGETPKALAFTVVDGGLIGGLVAARSEGTRWSFGLGLLASHTFQCLDGIAGARRSNRRHAGLPFSLAFGWGDLAFPDRTAALDLYRGGPADRLAAQALTASYGASRPFMLHADLASPAVGFSYRFAF